MAGIRNDMQVGFRPGTMKIPGTRQGTYYIITPLHNDAGYPSDPIDILNQIVVRFEEGVVHKVVAFDACKCERKLRVGKPLNYGWIEKKLGSTSFPDAPGARRFQTRGCVFARQPPVIGADHVSAFRFWNDFKILFPDIRKERACALLIEPLNLFGATKKNSAQYEFSCPIGMSLGVSKCQRAAPGAAEHLPGIDAKMFAQLLDVGNQMPGGVLFKARVGSAPTRAALIEKHHAIELRI